MRTFQIKAFIGDVETPFEVQEETTGVFVISSNQKFVARLFKDPDDRWKTLEVSDLTPADINTLGGEIEHYMHEAE